MEILIEIILKKEHPELLIGLETDPEASLYFAYYEQDYDSEERSKKLFEVVKNYLDKKIKLNNFIQKYEDDIEWE